MKYIVNFSLLLLVLLSSCGKYLEKEPDNRAKLTDPTKVSQILVSAYPQANYMAFAEAMSDNAGDKGSGEADVTNSAPYAFQNVPNAEQDSPDNYWHACYTAIAAANEALEACNKATNPESYQHQKGEALVARAYAHFMLVTFYSKPYDEATATSNPGVPYVTEPETVVNKQYSRGTVAEVYEMIEKDLLEGLPLLDDALYKVPRYHFTRSAANAFAARFYLYKKDYAKVVQYAGVAVPDFLPNLRPWNTTYQTYGINNLPAEYQKSTESANLLLLTCSSIYNYGLAYVRYRYGYTPVIMNEIFDEPLGVTGGDWSYITGFVGSQRNPAVPKLNYTDFAQENPTSDFGLPYGTICLFTTEEVLFNKAEANAYLGNYDAAIKDLNIFMSTRLTGVTPGTLSGSMAITQSKVRQHYSNTLNIQNALVKYILELKRVEFVHEGMRWFDVLRYALPIEHEFVDPGGAVINTIQVGADDKLRQLKLPDAVKLSGITDLNR
jgi:starch-binding outer membrane protein, SusD/RagB family